MAKKWLDFTLPSGTLGNGEIFNDANSGELCCLPPALIGISAKFHKLSLSIFLPLSSHFWLFDTVYFEQYTAPFYSLAIFCRYHFFCIVIFIINLCCCCYRVKLTLDGLPQADSTMIIHHLI